MRLKLLNGFFPIVKTQYAESFVSRFTKGEKAVKICLMAIQSECFLVRRQVLSMETYLSNHIESFVFYLRKFQESAYCLVGTVFDGLNSNLNHMPISPHVVVTQLANY